MGSISSILRIIIMELILLAVFLVCGAFVMIILDNMFAIKMENTVGRGVIIRFISWIVFSVILWIYVIRSKSASERIKACVSCLYAHITADFAGGYDSIGFAVTCTHAGLNPDASAQRTLRTFDHAAQ